MSQPKSQHTSIEDISLVGEEMSDEHLRLVYGGLLFGGYGGYVKQTHYPTQSATGSTTTTDSDTSDPKNDSLYTLAF